MKRWLRFFYPFKLGLEAYGVNALSFRFMALGGNKYKYLLKMYPKKTVFFLNLFRLLRFIV